MDFGKNQKKARLLQMRDMAKGIDLSVLDEIVKMAEKAMAKGVSKKKPDMAIMELSVEGKPMQKRERMGQEMESEDMGEDGDEEMDPQSKMEISEGGVDVEVEPEDGADLSEADIMDLIEAYKSKKG